VPAIIQSHFLRLKIGHHPPLSLFLAGEVAHVNTFTVTARLPGFNDDEYERDATRFGDVMMARTDTSTSQPIGIRWRPHRDEVAELESRYDAACVVVDWDGRNDYPSRDDPRRRLTLSEHVIEECQIRLNRWLTKKERREILHQVTPQIDEARRKLIQTGWFVHGNTDPATPANWVARKLLKPSMSWATITGVDADQLPSAFRSIHRFADRAMLALPVRGAVNGTALY
jgi:hypothetical protein